MNPKFKIKHGLTTYKVTMTNGKVIHTVFVRARTQSDAQNFALEEKENYYGKHKGTIKSVTEVTKRDIEDYPAMLVRPKMQRNPTGFKGLLPLVIIGGLAWLLLRNK